MNPPGDRQGTPASPTPLRGPGEGAGLCRRQRLVRRAHFAEGYQQGRKWVGTYMVLWLREGEDASLRLGVVASRKVGGAVQRNRARRRLREAFRVNRSRYRGAVDVILVARRAIGRARASEVEEELNGLAARAGLLSAEQTGPEGRGAPSCAG
jgi:ribonuclease P protein component